MNYTQCFEHDRLYRAGSPISTRLGVVELPASLFDWLLSQVGQPNGQWLRLDAMGRVPVLKAQQYAGVVRSPCGHVLEILPKTGHAGHTPAQARRVLLTMLSQLPDFKALQLGSAAVAHAQVPLLEVFIGLALTQFEQLLHHGLRSHYVSQHAQRPVLRGKLLMAEQLKHNIAHRERFYTEHDEYVRNRAENRLIRAALRCTLQWTRYAMHRHRAHALDQRLLDIPPATQIEQDLRQVQLDRNMQHYQAPLAWATLILGAAKPLAGAGSAEALSLLFDLNRLFEKSVEVAIQKQLPSGHQLLAQHAQQRMLKQGHSEQRPLKPDLLYQIEGRPHAILDAKWKLLTRASMADIAADDLHQMALYAAAYLPNGGTVYLIYPQTPQFQTLTRGWYFQHVAAGKVELCLLPFCVEQWRLLDHEMLMHLQLPD